MVSFFRIIIFLSLFTIICFNLFSNSKNRVFFAIYPYLILINITMVISLIVLSFINNNLLTIGISYFVGFIFLVIFYQIIKIERNINGKSNYELKYKDYVKELPFTNKEDYGNINKVESGIVNLVQGDENNFLTNKNKISLIFKEEDICTEMFKMIKDAQHHIHLQFYIVRDDKLGQKLKNLLIEKAEQGVQVRFIYDALGGHSIKKGYREELKEFGVKVGIYSGFINSILKGRLNHRLHRKLLITDGLVGFTTDLNIGEEYIGEESRESIGLKIEGEAVRFMQKMFLIDWYYLKDEKIIAKDYFPESSIEENINIQLANGGYDVEWNKIEQSYFALLNSATEKIYLVTPYLTLNSSLLESFQIAALRGVEVNIILSKKTNNFLVDLSNSTDFKELLKAGVNIYLYGEQFLHTKALVIDNKILSLGSANFNNRAYYLDYETNIIIYNKAVAEEMVDRLKIYLMESNRLKTEYYLRQSFGEKVKTAIGDIITPLN